MADIFLVIPFAASFFIVFLLMPFWIRKARQIGLAWKDMNKFKERRAAGSGGIVVLFGFVIGVLLYVAYMTFYLRADSNLVEVFAILIAILILGTVGFVDDLLGWQRGGLSKRSRIILCAVAAIPFMVINAGKSLIGLPFFGTINLWLIYPLILIPIGIIGATTTFNFLAGFNGLEAGQGILLLAASGVVAYMTGNPWLAIIALCMIVSLLAFLFFNFSPARVFPGDVLTYSVGGLVAAMCILGNFEKIAVFFFMPYIVEFVLKARGGLIKSSFGKPQKEGGLGMLYEKIYGLEHLAIYLMKKFGVKATEKRVVYLIWTFQIIIILIGFLVFGDGIF